MSTEVSLFYNQEACKDVLILIADESSYPDKVEKYEDVIILKNKDRIVGINILNSLEYVKIKASGLIHSVNEQLAKLIENKEEIEKVFAKGSCHILKVRKLGGCKVID